ncbi:uncharacterized protein LOC135388366 [Ornithodoros turicata]|uniref:uncharacterized protein LOC135388366 n=1 Tax=Ornithodoros turicata TaxID=34597 RepID=UPI003139F67E
MWRYGTDVLAESWNEGHDYYAWPVSHLLALQLCWSYDHILVKYGCSDHFATGSMFMIVASFKTVLPGSWNGGDEYNACPCTSETFLPATHSRLPPHTCVKYWLHLEHSSTDPETEAILAATGDISAAICIHVHYYLLWKSTKICWYVTVQ